MMRHACIRRWGVAAFFAFLLNSPLLIAQDLYVRWVVEVPSLSGQPEKVTMGIWCAPERMRIEQPLASGIAKVYRNDLGIVWTINEANKIYTEEASPAQTPPAGLTAESPPVSMKAAESHKKIGEWDCAEYVVTVGGDRPVTWEIWATPDIRIDPAVLAQMIEIVSPTPVSPAEMDKIKSIKGFPVRVVAKQPVGDRSVESGFTAFEISTDRIDRGQFKPPAAFVKVASLDATPPSQAVREGTRPPARAYNPPRTTSPPSNPSPPRKRS